MFTMNRVRLPSKNEEDDDFTVEFYLSDFHSLEISVNGWWTELLLIEFANLNASSSYANEK